MNFDEFVLLENLSMVVFLVICLAIFSLVKLIVFLDKCGLPLARLDFPNAAKMRLHAT